MRALWTGEVSFGLVSVPVKVISATENHDVSLHQVHDADGGRIRYERRCEVCDEVIDYADIDRAYQDGDRTVVITKDELGHLPADESHEIAVQQFVPEEQIDALVLDKAYYLQPASSSAKSYVLLRRTLAESSRVAIVTFTLRSRTRLAVLRIRGEAIVLQTLRWDDELREPDFEIPTARISAKEREMAASLVESYAEDFAPERFEDDYQAQLRALIEEKLEHGEDIDTEATFGDPDGADDDSDGDVIDLMEALKRSVDSRRATKGTAAASSASTKAGGKAGGKKGGKAGGKTGTKPRTKKTGAKTSQKKGSAKKTG